LQDRKTTLPTTTFNLLLGRLRNRDYGLLATCFTDLALDVTGAEAYRTLLQVQAFFKKNVCFTDPLAARLAALLSFEKGEQLCEATNNRLDDFYFQPSGSKEPLDLELAVKKCQRYIARVLGYHRDFLEELPELIQVTAGATATRSRRRALPFLKVSKRLVCTPGAFPYLDNLSVYFGYGPLGGRLVGKNRVCFVPKSWKTERTIACEAEGNMFLQLAFDKYAKRRLRKVGINLSDQTRNQELAKEGSIYGKFSTVDLSMASDTLGYNVVALLFNEEWFHYLRAIRSQSFEVYPGRKEQYHKFSSMGNGSTFSVETLVFAAACHAVGSNHYSVYGDDIIIERAVVEDLLALLAFLGFVPNIEKTFIDGPFRESCGSHWYEGIDITPRYIAELDNRKATWCHLVNSMMAICDPNGSLIDYLSRLVRDKKLPLIPFNKDSMSGVWITPSSAYAKKLIQMRQKWIPKVRAYQPTSKKSVKDWSSRSLFLWHLSAKRRVEENDLVPWLMKLKYFGNPNSDPTYKGESSRYTTSSHRYRRKWVHWIPVAGAPDQIHIWSELLDLVL
jgi:hypothetical protein